MTAPHLWEIDHPYYCEHGNYFVSPASGEAYSHFDSWAEFIANWGDADPDMNLVFRWDWKRADPSNYGDGEELPPDALHVYWVLQGKAFLRSTECVVTEADEPAVRAWLTGRAKTMAAVWDPFLTAGTDQDKS